MQTHGATNHCVNVSLPIMYGTALRNNEYAVSDGDMQEIVVLVSSACRRLRGNTDHPAGRGRCSWHGVSLTFNTICGRQAKDDGGVSCIARRCMNYIIKHAETMEECYTWLAELSKWLDVAVMDSTSENVARLTKLLPTPGDHASLPVSP